MVEGPIEYYRKYITHRLLLYLSNEDMLAWRGSINRRYILLRNRNIGNLSLKRHR